MSLAITVAIEQLADVDVAISSSTHRAQLMRLYYSVQVRLPP
jgi:hypothetical protein